MSNIDEILKQRAELLAARQQEVEEERMLLVEFTLGQEHYAIAIEFTKEVHPCTKVTKLTQAPRYIAGVTNIRQQIISIVDLQEMLNLPPKKEELARKILVLEHQDMVFALLVDDVLSTFQLPKSALEEPPTTFGGLQKDLLKGVTKDQLIVLDGEAFFTKEEFIVKQEVS